MPVDPTDTDDLLAYAGGELDGARRVAFELRLAREPDLAQTARCLATAWSALACEPEAVSPGFNQRLRARVQASGAEADMAESDPAGYAHALAALQGLPETVSADFNERLRQQLVGEWAGGRPEAAEPTGAQAACPTRRRRFLHVAHRVVGLAALVAIAAAGLWLGVLAIPRTQAYTLADLPGILRRISALQLRIRSEQVEGSGPDAIRTMRTARYYFERPDRFVVISDLDGTRGAQVSDGRRYQRVDHDARRVVTGAEVPIHARLIVESALQTGLLQDLRGNLNDYRRLGSQTVESVQTDVYERVAQAGPGTHRTRVWMDPEAGLPVRIRWFIANAGKPESMVAEYDEIDFDVDMPPGTFLVEPPAGYEIVHADRAASDVGIGFSKSEDMDACVGLPLNYDGRAVLTCWWARARIEDALREPATVELDHGQAVFEPYDVEGAWPHEHHALEVADRARKLWRWSLVVPSTPGERITDRPFVWQFAYDGQSCGVQSMPLTLGESQARNVLEQLLALTMSPADARAAAHDLLGQVEALLPPAPRLN